MTATAVPRRPAMDRQKIVMYILVGVVLLAGVKILLPKLTGPSTDSATGAIDIPVKAIQLPAVLTAPAAKPVEWSPTARNPFLAPAPVKPPLDGAPTTEISVVPGTTAAAQASVVTGWKAIQALHVKGKGFNLKLETLVAQDATLTWINQPYGTIHSGGLSATPSQVSWLTGPSFANLAVKAENGKCLLLHASESADVVRLQYATLPVTSACAATDSLPFGFIWADDPTGAGW